MWFPRDTEVLSDLGLSNWVVIAEPQSVSETIDSGVTVAVVLMIKQQAYLEKEYLEDS